MSDEHNPPDEQLIEQLRSIWQEANQTEPPPARAISRARALYDATAFQSHRNWSLHLFAFPRRLALGAALLVVLLFALSGGLAYAAQSALPGEPLYPSKTAVEQLQLALVQSKTDRAGLELEFAGRRVDEIQTLATRGQYEWIASTTAAYEHHVYQIARDLATAPGAERQVQALATKAEADLEKFSRTLSRVGKTSPVTTQREIDHALGISAGVQQDIAGTVLEKPKATPTPTLTFVPRSTFTPSATLAPTSAPTRAPSSTATAIPPSETPEPAASATPTLSPVLSTATGIPMSTSTAAPTAKPAPKDTAAPTDAPKPDKTKPNPPDHTPKPTHEPKPTRTPRPKNTAHP